MMKSFDSCVRALDIDPYTLLGIDEELPTPRPRHIAPGYVRPKRRTSTPKTQKFPEAK